MAPNINNDEAHRLARKLAEVQGLSITDAVTEPIQSFLEQLTDRDARDTDEILGYDEHGLPG